MSKELTPFTVLYNMNKGILHTEDEVKKSGLNFYLLLQFIRTNNILINIATYLNQNYKYMSLYDQYLFIFLTFKRFKINNVKWVKSDKAFKEKDVENIMKFYTVTHKIALRYLEHMSKEKINEINQYYDKGGVK